MDDPTLVVRQLINELRDDMSEAAVNSEIAALGISNAPSSSLMPEPNPTGLFEPQGAASLVPSPPAT